MPHIHPTAIVDPSVVLADDVAVGPYAILSGKVTIGAGSSILSHTVINGSTIIGQRCRFGPGAYIGLDPQHTGYKGEETWLIIGDDTIAREGASIHRAFKTGQDHATRVGSNCFLMANAHIGHDCRVADRVILAQGAMLGGHVEVGERTFLGGGAGVHQFCRVGRLAIIRGTDAVTRDVPPFAAVAYFALKGYNAIGCKRSGMPRESVFAIRKAYHCLHTHRALPTALRAIRETVPSAPEVDELLNFIASSKRGITPSARYFFAAMSSHGDDESDE